jgi:hypothetical protein
MPWQKYVADVAGEIDPETGLPAYREVVVTVPRQSGKTTLFLSFQVHRSVAPRWSHPQRSAFTAQTGKDARDKWLDELFPLLRNSRLKSLIGQINEGMGNEAVRWDTGSIIRLLSTSSSTGHSKTLHQAVLDEIWADADDRREQGLRPAMITVPDAQLLVCSTAGTQASTVLNRKVQTGRDAVAADTGRGVAFFEWSAPDEWDPADEETWYSFMPALCPAPPCRCGDGWRHTVTSDSIRLEREAMDPAEFRRAYGNRPTGGSDLIIPPEAWRRVCDETARPEGRLRFALDVAEDRSSAAICAFGDGVVELIDHRPGLGWVVERCNELSTRHGGSVAVDYGGPAGVLADQLDRCEALNSREVVKACGGLYDAILENRVVFRSDPAFDAAVEGAVKKPVGDNWVWSRKASVADVSPLMAATLAFREGEEPSPPPAIAVIGL